LPNTGRPSSPENDHDLRTPLSRARPRHGTGEFLELTGDGLRSLVARDAELSDIFMRPSFSAAAIISQGQGNVILLGSRHSANTLRLREFLSRNGYPYRYVDLDTDNTSKSFSTGLK